MSHCYQSAFVNQYPKIMDKLNNAKKLLDKLYNCYVMWSTPDYYPKLDKDKIKRESDKVLKSIFFYSGDGHYDANNNWIDFTYDIQPDAYNKLTQKYISSRELEYFAEWSIIYFYLNKMKKFILSLKPIKEIDDKAIQYSLSYNPYAPTIPENEYCIHLYRNCHKTIVTLQKYYNTIHEINYSNNLIERTIYGHVLEFQLASFTCTIVKNIPTNFQTNFQEDKENIAYTEMYEEALNNWEIKNQIGKMKKIYTDLKLLRNVIISTNEFPLYEEELKYALICMNGYISEAEKYNDFISSKYTRLYNTGIELDKAIQKFKDCLVAFLLN